MASSKQIVTTTAMSNFVSGLKETVYNWADPAGTTKESWTDAAAAVGSNKYKLVPTSKNEILTILKNAGLSKK